MYDVIVIGAGLAGTLSAIELSKKYKVLLLEAGSEVIPESCTSYNECYKLHTGMHFLGDVKTAEHCLRKAVEFGRRFFSFIKDSNNPDAPWRRGRHYIMDNSHVSAETAKGMAFHLRDLYAKMVQDNPEAAVFGSPDNFIKILDMNDHQFSDSIPFYDQNDILSYTKVQLAIETGESQIDILALRAYLQQLVIQNSNIDFVPNTRVLDIKANDSYFGYSVCCHDQEGVQSSFVAKCVVSAAWQDNELITKNITQFEPNDARINRVKVSIQVKLPAELMNMNTCLFSSGPFASITNLGNGSAILTSERYSNIGFYLSGSSKLPEDLQSKIDSLSMDEPEGLTLAQNILSDCASYFSSRIQALFLTAAIEEIHIGYIKLINIDKPYTEQAIFEDDSVIHSRRFDGVERVTCGLVTNAGMKMTYTVANASKTTALIDEDIALIAICDAIVEETKKRINQNIARFLNPGIEEIIYKNFKSDLIAWAELIKDKQALLSTAAASMKQKIERLYYENKPSCFASGLLFSNYPKQEIRPIHIQPQHNTR